MSLPLVYQWLSDDGFLSFYHRFHKKHGAPFADSVHNTAVWLMSEYLVDNIDKEELKKILVKGLKTRTRDKLIYRYPNSNEILNRDQLTPLIPLLREVGLDSLADDMVRIYAGPLLPHWRDHFYDKSTWLGRIFECGDSISDWFSDSESSQVKNIVRLSWASFKGRENKTAIRLFRKKVNPIRVMEIFGSRLPTTHPSEYDRLPGMIGVNSPPPIFLQWRQVIDIFM